MKQVKTFIRLLLLPLEGNVLIIAAAAQTNDQKAGFMCKNKQKINIKIESVYQSAPFLTKMYFQKKKLDGWLGWLEVVAIDNSL